MLWDLEAMACREGPEAVVSNPSVTSIIQFGGHVGYPTPMQKGAWS